jgi:HAMP domain-containing protein
VEQAKAWKSAWDQLAARVDQRAVKADESFSEHSRLVAANIDVIDTVADASGLSLDPVAESYYLMTAMVDHLPRLLEATARLRGQGAGMLASGKDDPTENASLAALMKESEYLHGRAAAQIGKAVELSAEVKQALAGTLAAKNTEVDNFVKLTRSGLIERTGAEPAAGDFFKAGTAAVDAQTRTLAATTQALEDLLHDRIHSTQVTRATVLAALAGLGLLALLLGVAITRSVTRPLGHAVDAANAVASGDLNFQIDDRGSDEAAQLLHRFSQMQDSLRERQQQDAQRMADTQAEAEMAQRTAEEIGDAVDAANQGDFSRRIGTEGKEPSTPAVQQVQRTGRDRQQDHGARCAWRPTSSARRRPRCRRPRRACRTRRQPAGRQRGRDHRVAAGDQRRRSSRTPTAPPSPTASPPRPPAGAWKAALPWPRRWRR